MEKTAIEKLAELKANYEKEKANYERESQKIKEEAETEAKEKINKIVEQLEILFKSFPHLVSVAIVKFASVDKEIIIPKIEKPLAKPSIPSTSAINFARRSEVFNPENKAMFQKVLRKYPKLALTKGKRYQIVEEKSAGKLATPVSKTEDGKLHSTPMSLTEALQGMLYVINDDNNMQVEVSDKLFVPFAQVGVNNNKIGRASCRERV